MKHNQQMTYEYLVKFVKWLCLSEEKKPNHKHDDVF